MTFTDSEKLRLAALLDLRSRRSVCKQYIDMDIRYPGIIPLHFFVTNEAFYSHDMSSSNSSSSRTDIAAPPESEKQQNNVEESKVDRFEVNLESHEHPQSLPLYRRWLVVLVIASSALCVTCASSAASFTEAGVASTFHVSHEVTILAISLFVGGLGLGPLLAGPLSEVYGRNIIYRISFILLFAFSFGVAFAPNIGELQ